MQSILVVDDEEDIRTLMDHLLRTGLPGVDVRTAASGTEGLALLRSHRADVILSDFRMPAMDGVEFLTRSRPLAPAARRLLMTAFLEMEVTGERLNAAALHAVLGKPFDPDEIVAVLQAALQVAAPASS